MAEHALRMRRWATILTRMLGQLKSEDCCTAECDIVALLGSSEAAFSQVVGEDAIVCGCCNYSKTCQWCRLLKMV